MNNSSAAISSLTCSATVCCNRGSTNYVVVVGYPVLLFFCTVGSLLNTIAIFGAGRFTIREILIVSMAFFDCSSMWLFMPKYLTAFASYMGIPQDTYPPSIMAHSVLTWLSYSANHSSDLIIVLFSCERLFAFRWPYQHQQWKERCRLAVWAALAVAVLGLLLRVQYMLHRYFINTQANIRLQCGRHLDDFVYPGWLSAWTEIDSATRLAIQITFSLLLLFVNAWILLILRNRLHISGGKRPPKAPTVCLSVNQADVTLLGSSILFMSTQLPIAVRNLFIYTQLKENLPAKLLADLEPIVLFLNMVNYSTDFLVYAGMSAKYRQWIATEVFRRKRHAVKAPTHRLT